MLPAFSGSLGGRKAGAAVRSAKAVLPSGKLGVGAAKFGLRLGNEVLPMAKAEVFKTSPDLRSGKAGPGDTGAGLSKE
jgi:hypothetical protein